MTSRIDTPHMIHSKDKITFIAILIAFALPPIAAYTLYFTDLLPTGTSNKGTLIQPMIQLPSQYMADPKIKKIGSYFSHGYWNMVMTIPHSCQADCQKNIYFMRQVQTALGKDSRFIRRSVLTQPIKTDNSTHDFTNNVNHKEELSQFLADYPKLNVMSTDADLTSLFRQIISDYQLRIFIIDPLGHVMMYYPKNVEPKDLLSDLKRLILVNHQDL